jgi:hypothetical protein
VSARGRIVAAAFAGACAITLAAPMSPASAHGNIVGDPGSPVCPGDPAGPTKTTPVTTVLGDTFTQPDNTGSGNVSGAGSLLPLTGADIAVIVVAGVALIGSGGGFLLVARQTSFHRRRRLERHLRVDADQSHRHSARKRRTVRRPTVEPDAQDERLRPAE